MDIYGTRIPCMRKNISKKWLKAHNVSRIMSALLDAYSCMEYMSNMHLMHII